MKKLIILTCLVHFSGCNGTGPERADKPAFKGMELYSWKPEDGNWHFWLLPGTNGTKAGLGIFKPASAMIGLDRVKDALSKLPKGEMVGWQHIGQESVPDHLVADLTELCRQHNISIMKIYFEKISIE